MPDEDVSIPAPTRTALGSLPYAVPLALGLTCLTWGLTDLVTTFTDSYWVLWELVPALVGLTVGAGFLLFGGVGALACVGRES
jgi:hypothetical protein